VCTSQKSLDIHKREKHGMLKEWSMPQQHQQHQQQLQQQLQQQQLQQHQGSILQSSISAENFLGPIFVLNFGKNFQQKQHIWTQSYKLCNYNASAVCIRVERFS
jgi:hypothetical protein